MHILAKQQPAIDVRGPEGTNLALFFFFFFFVEGLVLLLILLLCHGFVFAINLGFVFMFLLLSFWFLVVLTAINRIHTLQMTNKIIRSGNCVM